MSKYFTKPLTATFAISNATALFLNSVILAIIAILATIARIILAPIGIALSAIFPDLTAYVGQVEVFFSQYIVPNVAFTKEVMINVTGVARPLLNILIGWYVAKISFAITVRIIRFVLNIYKLFKGGSTEAGGEMVE